MQKFEYKVSTAYAEFLRTHFSSFLLIAPYVYDPSEPFIYLS